MISINYLELSKEVSYTLRHAPWSIKNNEKNFVGQLIIIRWKN